MSPFQGRGGALLFCMSDDVCHRIPSKNNNITHEERKKLLL